MERILARKLVADDASNASRVRRSSGSGSIQAPPTSPPTEAARAQLKDGEESTAGKPPPPPPSRFENMLEAKIQAKMRGDDAAARARKRPGIGEP